jgi:hypothetical protein
MVMSDPEPVNKGLPQYPPFIISASFFYRCSPAFKYETTPFVSMLIFAHENNMLWIGTPVAMYVTEKQITKEVSNGEEAAFIRHIS